VLAGVWGTIVTIMTSWHQGKLFVEHALTVSHDVLHLLLGLLVWILIALAGRRPLTSWRPWLWLLALILWNEAVDLWVERWPDPGQQYGEGAKDLLLTMVVPTIVMLAARLRPDLFRHGLDSRRGKQR
jgi:hypothetical protein